MRLPVRMRIHCGIGRFWFIFLASVFLTAIDLLAGCKSAERDRSKGSESGRSNERWNKEAANAAARPGNDRAKTRAGGR